jgi:hypothetical protein
MLPAHHTGITDSASNGHSFAPDAPVTNYNPQAPTVGVCVANGHPERLVASATLASATARVANGHPERSVASATLASTTLLRLVAFLGHVMPSCLTFPILSLAWDHLPT